MNIPITGLLSFWQVAGFDIYYLAINQAVRIPINSAKVILILKAG